MKRLIILGALALSACGTAVAPPGSPKPLIQFPALPSNNPATQLADLIQSKGIPAINADFDQATAYAQVNDPILGAPCFPAEKAFVDNLPPLPGVGIANNISKRPPALGPITMFEYGRVDRITTEGSVSTWRTQIESIIAHGPPPALLAACGGLFLDEQNFWLRMLALLGAGAATGGVAPVIAPALPALGAAAGAALP